MKAVPSRPIEDYGLLSDRHGAALVSRDGSVDWLCLPRFDSPSVFAALLDADAGHFSLRPTEEARSSRRYLPNTMALSTEFTTSTGTVQVTDALSTGPAGDPHRLGEGAERLLLREVHCSAGTAEVALEFRPRPEYGRVVPALRAVEGGVRARGGPAALALSSPLPLTVAGGGTALGTVRLSAGETARFALHYAALSEPKPFLLSQDEIARRLTETVTAWHRWSAEHRTYDGPWCEEVRFASRVLQALSYQPTGAIVAAPTTSLPEHVGGDRNWDYRYTWIRDAAFTMDALWTAACPDEADEFFTFMADAAATGWTRTHLQIMYGIGGEHDLTERELPHLSGWHASRPVRVGNAAWNQPQVDVYGELLDAAARFAPQLDAANGTQRAFLISLADAAAEAWREPDHGIWEIRGAPRDFLYSKLMCWVALDRALKLADHLRGGRQRAETWRTTREKIRTAIERHGFNEIVGAFTQSFGSTALDASALMLPITGFLPATDPRMLATLDAITKHLTDDRGLVLRYRTDQGVDGLPAGEGSFLLCTFWLAHVQALAGRTAEARATFERAASCANDLGLLAEQADPSTGTMLGNFPQAFSHIGLVNAAWAIHCAEQAQNGERAVTAHGTPAGPSAD